MKAKFTASQLAIICFGILLMFSSPSQAGKRFTCTGKILLNDTDRYYSIPSFRTRCKRLWCDREDKCRDGMRQRYTDNNAIWDLLNLTSEDIYNVCKNNLNGFTLYYRAPKAIFGGATYDSAHATSNYPNCPELPEIKLVGDNNVCSNAPNKPSLTATEAPEGYNYQWFKDGQPISGENNQELLNISESGSYHVSYTIGEYLFDDSTPISVTIKPHTQINLEVNGNNGIEFDGRDYLVSVDGFLYPLPALYTGNTSISNYTWSSPRANNLTHADRRGTYTATHTAANSCTSTLRLNVDSGGITASVNNQYYCLYGEPDNSTYVWKLEGVDSNGLSTLLSRNPENANGVMPALRMNGLVDNWINGLNEIRGNFTADKTGSCFSILDTSGVYEDFNLFVGVNEPSCKISHNQSCQYNPIMWKVDTKDCLFPPKSMVAKYSFETGTEGYLNNPISTLGKIGNSLQFNNTNSVELASKPELNFGTEDFSIMMWVKTQEFRGRLLSKQSITPEISGAGYSLYIFDGKLGLMLSTGEGIPFCGDNPSQSCTNYDSGMVINDNQWHLVAISIDRDSPTNSKFYLDGKEILSFDPTMRQLDISNEEPIRMGMFEGELDEVILFNRAISATEIQQTYASSNGICSIEAPETEPVNTDALTCKTSIGKPVDAATNCGITQLCNLEWADHKAYSRYIRQFTRKLFRAGDLTKKQFKVLNEKARRSNCGKSKKPIRPVGISKQNFNPKTFCADTPLLTPIDRKTGCSLEQLCDAADWRNNHFYGKYYKMVARKLKRNNFYDKAEYLALIKSVKGAKCSIKDKL